VPRAAHELREGTAAELSFDLQAIRGWIIGHTAEQAPADRGRREAAGRTEVLTMGL
jgi:hypothetical protein